MSPCGWRAMVGAMVVMTVAGMAWGQQQVMPRIGYVYPAGGRQGASFQIAVGGQYLDATNEVHVSGSGVRATVIEHTKPLTPAQLLLLRDRLKELLDKRTAAQTSGGKATSQPSTKPAWTAEDEKMLAEVRKKLANPPRRQGNPAIAETVTVQVTMAADAEPGERELRLRTPTGMSNPLVFCVGQLPEFTEKESRTSSAPGETIITLPANVNGQIMPGDVDRYRFKASQGQRVVVAANARGLIPYLPDAVPGWFQATLALYDASGKELAYDDDFRFNPDPVLYYVIPKDGEYVVEIKDAIYRGREDFVYRIAVGELPFVTSVFPLGGRIGAQTDVETMGWNLPTAKLTYDSRGKSPGTYPLAIGKGQIAANRVPFAVDTLPECLEKEPNNKPESAQAVTQPTIVNGRIDQPGDWDVFQFSGRGGEQIVAEVYARRLNSPLDSVLRLTDATGKQLAFNDDHEDKGTGLLTHHADSWLSATLPADGTYYLYLGDTQHKGGTEYAYRLRISSPRPDFELRIAPSSINARGGATVPITVYALRKDGYSGDIELALKNAPAGFALSGGRVPANQVQVRMTLTVPSRPSAEPYSLSLEGRATVQGREIVRAAVPAEDMMQAFAYRHLVPVKQLLVSATGRWAAGSGVRILSQTPIRIPAGGTARVKVGAPNGGTMDRLNLELSEPPEGISIRSVTPTREGAEIVLQSDGSKAKVGLKGNLIISASATRSGSSGNGKAQGNSGRRPVATLPAIAFEIVAKQGDSSPSGTQPIRRRPLRPGLRP